MIHKAYKDECYTIGFAPSDQFFDGYVDIPPAEKKKFEKIDWDFWKMQVELSKRWKKK